MNELLQILLTPKFILIYGPVWVFAIIEGIALYLLWKQYLVLEGKYIDAVEKFKDDFLNIVNKFTGK
jgi:hypothetical protein